MPIPAAAEPAAERERRAHEIIGRAKARAARGGMYGHEFPEIDEMLASLLGYQILTFIA
jgi:hypothetical protein